MMKSIALLGALSVAALASSSANAATVIPLGTISPQGYFFVTASTPSDSMVTANFGASPKSGAFDDQFTFTLPLSGTGSGSVSTSFSSAATQLTITSVLINGKSYSAAQASAGISGIPITAKNLNTIEVIGTGGSTISTFSGTATFTATAVPEPATWATFLLGFGFMGFALRRKLAGSLATA